MSVPVLISKLKTSGLTINTGAWAEVLAVSRVLPIKNPFYYKICKKLQIDSCLPLLYRSILNLPQKSPPKPLLQISPPDPTALTPHEI